MPERMGFAIMLVLPDGITRRFGCLKGKGWDRDVGCLGNCASWPASPLASCPLRPASRLLADQVQMNLPAVRDGAMFKQVNALPCAQDGAPVYNGNGQGNIG